ncbi:aminopeptidase [Candidatus Woesearchaeota archaeon]|nr:aminopeptidase [Candidatus Woesearchaeota archaeon]
MATIEQAADIAIQKCLEVKEGEKVLVITDENLKSIGVVLLAAAKKITEAKLIEIPIGVVSGAEPPKWVKEEADKADVLLIPTTKSLTHTSLVKDACERNARVATLPGITKETMERCIDVDYDEMAKRSNKLKEILDKGKEVRVVTAAGTDIRMSIDGREAEASYGRLRVKGRFGNLPSGETFISPIEETADGIYVVDGSILKKMVDEPIRIIVENGFAVRIDGGEVAEELREVLDKVKDKNAFNFAELGIGTNDKAEVIGNVLEDEKVMGTCHIALGKNSSFGGKVDVPIHLDGILFKPTIYVDGVKIIEDGKIL